eukprot:jgi/Tetstr1/424392/TSEL_014951.t1
MAKELRKSRGEELFAVAVREVFDAVAELRTDQSTEWTEELKESLMEFADIIAEPTDLPPEREFDFEINLESDEPPRNERQIKMDPRKVEAVQQWPVPKTVKDVRGFLGLAGYYRKFIHNFAAIAAPLHDLTKNQPEFVWTPRADAAFRALKDAMRARGPYKTPIPVWPAKETVKEHEMSRCMQIEIEESEDGMSAVVTVFEAALRRRLEQVPLAALPGDFVIRLQVLADATMIYKKGEV